MFWKLLRYDFRSMWKQFAFIWPATLIIALVNRFTLPFGNDQSALHLGDDNGILSLITMSTFMGIIFTMFVVSLLFIIKRFYRGLLGDEGYLMHTLPVSSWQLVGAKLICAVFVTVINTVVSILSILLIAPIDWRDLLDLALWNDIFRGLLQHPDSFLYLVEFILLCLACLVFGVTMLYLSMAIGHLFQRHRALMSVVTYFVLSIGGNIVNDFMGETIIGNAFYGPEQHLGIWILIAYCLVPAAAYFMGTCYILKNRLNLE